MRTAAADRRRLLLAAAAALLILGVAAGAGLLRAPGPQASGRGLTLTIAVIAPPPPAEIIAGDVMEVGGVVDGYVHRDLPLPAPVDVVPDLEEDWPREPMAAPPAAPPSTAPPSMAPPSMVPPVVPMTGDTPRTVDSLGLGFGPDPEPVRPPIRRAPPERMPDGTATTRGTGDRGALFY